MKKNAYLFVMFVTIVIFGLLGCGGKSKTTEKKTSQKISVIEADSEKESEQVQLSSDEVYTKQEVEDIVQKALEEAGRQPAAEAAPTFDEGSDPIDQDQVGESEDSSMTMNQKNAIKAAQDYLELTSFSHNGLVEQLSSEFADKYPREDAEFAVRYLEDHGMVDWNEQAVKAAQEYLELTSFSREGLIDQLTSEYGSQFTREQAEYAADKVGY